jgi:hypothetical protein
MVDEDHRIRTELAADGSLFRGYAERMAEVHTRNAAELAAIIDQVGWPGFSLVGAEGAEAAWVILQHAIGSPALQRKCVPLLAEAIARGEMAPHHLAYLEDRICFFERRPQRYGTGFDWDEQGQLSPWTLDEPDKVDQYRAEMGLSPLAEQIKQIRRNIEASGEKPPADFQQHQAKMLAWAKSVGWL